MGELTRTGGGGGDLWLMSERKRFRPEFPNLSQSGPPKTSKCSFAYHLYFIPSRSKSIISGKMNLGTSLPILSLHPFNQPDSDTDHPMRTPPTNSPPSSGDDRSHPSSPILRPQRNLMNNSGVMMQLSEYILETEGECSGKKKREEREQVLAEQAEMEKLLDKDWRDGMAPAP